MNDSLLESLDRLMDSQESLLKTYVKYRTALELIAEGISDPREIAAAALMSEKDK